MRIISGSLRGKKLVSFRGEKIRPTSDRIKESMFNILSDVVHDARVLDLYAGTGNLAMETLSRGALSAVMIDCDKNALSTIQRNIDICRFQSQSLAIRWDIRKNLTCIKQFHPAFNLVFMDPPYGSDLVPITLAHLHQSQSLSGGARLVVEHHLPFNLPADLQTFRLVDHRIYGKTLVSFLKYMI